MFSERGNIMKKLVNLFWVIFVVFLFCCAPASAASFNGGNGTENNPYKISTYEQLNQIRNYSDKYFIQTNNISVPDNTNWTPIDNFSGEYNGNGYTINGLKVSISNKLGDVYSSFIINNSGYIYNVEFINCSINATAQTISTTSTYKSYSSYAGGVVSTNNGTIENCGISGSISSSSGLNYAYCGGIAMKNQGEILCCYNKAQISAYNGLNTAYAGGIVASNSGSISNSYNMGSVSTGGCHGTAGGISATGGDIDNCYNCGDVAAKNDYSYTLYAGGILGSGGTTKASYWNIDSKQTVKTTSLENSKKKGIGSVGYGGKDTTVSKTSSEMKQNTFVELLNQGLSDKVWISDETGINNGYPILGFQNKLICSLPSGTYSNIQTLELSTTISGSEILYSTDESAPYIKYTAPIEIYKTSTVRISVSKDGVLCGNYSFDYTIPLPQTSSSVPSGTYNNIQKVKLNTNIASCDIYYTTDGSTPTNLSTKYNGEIEIYKTTTLKTIAIKNEVTGPITTYNYTLPTPAVSVSNGNGVYPSPIEVDISVTPDWYDEIYYTLDGTIPTTSSLIYDKAISIDENCVLNILVCYKDVEESIVQYAYEFSPTINTDIAPGSYEEIKYITLTPSISSYDVYYTTDGTIPTALSNKYDVPIEIYKTTTIKAVAIKNNTQSSCFSFKYTLPTPKITSNISSGDFDKPIQIELNSSVAWYDKIYYTLDGTQPDNTSLLYSEPILINENTTLKAVSYYKNDESSVKQYSYTFTPIVSADVDSGTFSEVKNITLNSSIQEYDIYYTLDGSDPKINGVLYQNPIEIYKTTTLKIIAVKNSSSSNTKTYTYSFPQPTVSANNNNVFSFDKKVEIVSNISGYEIYYTLDGSSPSKENGTKYTEPFNILKTSVLKAIALKEDVQSNVMETTLYVLPTAPLSIKESVQNDIKLAHGESDKFALCSNGTVRSSYSTYSNNYKIINDNWKMITDIAAGRDFVVGLQVDGTLCAVGDNTDNQCDINKWEDIVSITTGAYHTVGLKKDGTVVSTSPITNRHNQDDVKSWNNIVIVSAGAYHTLGLKSDGTVVATGTNAHEQCSTSSWQNIVDISAGATHSVGLKNDGTVVATGNNAFGQCNVEEWDNIIKIYAQATRTIGIKADGTFISTDGANFNDIKELSVGYSDIDLGINVNNQTNLPLSGNNYISLEIGSTINNINYLDNTKSKYLVVDLRETCSNSKILYTIDGSDPKIYGFTYSKPLKINDNTTLRFVPVEGGVFKEEVVYYYNVPADKNYKETVFVEHPINQNSDKITLNNLGSSTELVIKIYNTDLDINDATLYIATYENGGKMKDIIPRKCDLLFGETTLTISIEDISKQIEEIKIMIWDQNLMPYANAIMIEE